MVSGRLIVKAQQGEMIFPIEDSIYRIGRNPDNDIVLDADGVSRYHAVLEISDGKITLKDTDSTNGTWVAGQNGVLFELHGGEIIRFGRKLQAKFLLSREPDIEKKGAGEAKPSVKESEVFFQDADVVGSLKKMPLLSSYMKALLAFIALNLLLLIGSIFYYYLYHIHPTDEKASATLYSESSLFREAQLGAALDHVKQGLEFYETGNLESVKVQFDTAVDLLAGLPESDKYNRSLEILSGKLPAPLRHYNLEKIYKEIAEGENATFTFHSKKELNAYALKQLKAILNNFGQNIENIPEAFTERVMFYVHRFLNEENIFFSRALSRSSDYQPMIFRVFEEMHLPREFAYIPLIESGFNRIAKSHAGAAGLWQFMPGTARDYQLRVDLEKGVDDRLDIVKSTKAAAQYLKNLFMDFGGGSPLLVMAAYNAGENKIRRALRKGSNPFGQERTFWYLCEKQILPEETENYVPRILAAIIIAENSIPFGFGEIEEKVGPEEADLLIVKGGTSLILISKICKISLAELLALNADFAPDSTLVPSSSLQYLLKVPKGFGYLVAAELKRINENREELDTSDSASDK